MCRTENGELIASRLRKTKELHCVYAAYSDLRVAFTFYAKSFVQLENLYFLLLFFASFCINGKSNKRREEEEERHSISLALHTRTHLCYCHSYWCAREKYC